MSKVYGCSKCRVPAVHKEWRGDNHAYRLWWECPKCESSMHLRNMLKDELKDEEDETEEGIDCVVAVITNKKSSMTIDYGIDEESFNQLTVEEVIELKNLLKSLHEKCNRRLLQIQEDLNAGMAD